MINRSVLLYRTWANWRLCLKRSSADKPQ